MATKRARLTGLRPRERDLAEAALGARERAYAPYSRFRVGAAIQAEDGTVFVGCNVENASYGATVCAERNALASAVAAGRQAFAEIAIATGTQPPTPPCGLCRQVLSEFNPRLRILMVNDRGEVLTTRLDKLLPMAFTRGHL
jgi:cytidine deaminase